ncbi:hypothetical protein ABW20_dc0103015 [Dactylellina cionopaga]|nr:hypothetical protein ABW20_dc0103015 [Dactylellina cionopaga]
MPQFDATGAKSKVQSSVDMNMRDFDTHFTKASVYFFEVVACPEESGASVCE